MKDIEIAKAYNIPPSTLSNWKHKPNDDWRKIIYELLKKQQGGKTL